MKITAHTHHIIYLQVPIYLGKRIVFLGIIRMKSQVRSSVVIQKEKPIDSPTD